MAEQCSVGHDSPGTDALMMDARKCGSPPEKDICDSVTVWQCDSVTVWQCGSMTVWQCDSMTVWLKKRGHLLCEPEIWTPPADRQKYTIKDSVLFKIRLKYNLRWIILDQKKPLCLVTSIRRWSPLSGLSSSSCRGFYPLDNAFFALSVKKRAFHAVCAHFRSFLVFRSYLRNL